MFGRLRVICDISRINFDFSTLIVVQNKLECPSVCIFFSSSSLTSGLYYKPMTIVYDDTSVVNKLEASLTDDARVVIYNCHMFIEQATGVVLTALHVLYTLRMGPINQSVCPWQANLA